MFNTSIIHIIIVLAITLWPTAYCSENEDNSNQTLETIPLTEEQSETSQRLDIQKQFKLGEVTLDDKALESLIQSSFEVTKDAFESEEKKSSTMSFINSALENQTRDFSFIQSLISFNNS